MISGSVGNKSEEIITEDYFKTDWRSKVVFIGLRFEDFVDLRRFSVSFDHLVRHNHRRRKYVPGEDDDCELKI